MILALVLTGLLLLIETTAFSNLLSEQRGGLKDPGLIATAFLFLAGTIYVFVWILQAGIR